jgi:AraC-like DNA-binding protein
MFLARAIAKKISIAPLLERYALPEDAATQHELVVPLEAMQELPEVLAHAMGDSCLGLNMALAIPRGMYGLVEFGVRNAPTLGEALRRLARYTKLFDDIASTTFEVHRDEARIRRWIDGEPACFGRQGNELTTAVIFRLLSDAATPHKLKARRVWFAHAESSNRAKLAAFFGTQEVEFGVGSNGISLSASDLRLPVRDADPALRKAVDEYAERTLAKKLSSKPATLRKRLGEQIFLALRTGTPRLYLIAAEVGIGTRTLQRRLAEEKITFNELVEQVRRERARAYLADDALVLGEVAYLLGYSDLRAFVRAYKRWTGVTPGRHREKLRR